MTAANTELTVGSLAEIIMQRDSRHFDKKVRVCIHSPGAIGGTPSVAVVSAGFGFDWDNGTFLINTDEKLTKLTPEDVEAIRISVAKGGSWHAYQEWKKQDARIKELEAELRALKEKA